MGRYSIRLPKMGRERDDDDDDACEMKDCTQEYGVSRIFHETMR
jgi:hypothetical protein